MAYSIEIRSPVCNICNMTARVRVYKAQNAEVGMYCRRHGKQALRDVQQVEERTGQNR